MALSISRRAFRSLTNAFSSARGFSNAAVEYLSESLIQPNYIPEGSKQALYLSAWDLAMASNHYNQKGLLFAKPPAFESENQMKILLENLKDSLSLTLAHFYPLAGRLATRKQDNPPIYSIYVDCSNNLGVKFVHASVNLTIEDFLSPIYVPKIVHSFFDHVGAINHDGHTLPLLGIQITELNDGIFIGFSANHMVVDGTSFWHFINIWSEIFKAKAEGKTITISRPPILERYWFPEGHNLPFTHQDQFISRFQAPELKERYFHFSSDSSSKLKVKANAECNSAKISTFQAVVAHVWRCITKARNLPPDQETSCKLYVNNRPRLNPPLPEGYLGNCIHVVAATATCGELLGNGVGWAAWKIHQLVINHTDRVAREWVESWAKSPIIYKLGQSPNSIQIGSSPRFNIYGNEFGLGKPIAIRSGYANKYDGKIAFLPGREGGGSLDFEICLSPDSMNCLESDMEFMEFVTSSSPMN